MKDYKIILHKKEKSFFGIPVGSPTVYIQSAINIECALNKIYKETNRTKDDFWFVSAELICQEK